MHPPSGNLFQLPAKASTDEVFEELAAVSGTRIERIVSRGQRSPDGFWYDQPAHEWVVLLEGAASLRFEDEQAPRELAPGDWVWIEAHRRHRVEATHPTEATIWLAVHVESAKP